MSNTCDTEFKSLGAKCGIFDPRALKGFAISALQDNDGVANEFATVAEAKDVANWQTKIQLANTRPDQALYPLGAELDNVEDAPEDAVFEEGTSGAKYFVRKGKRVIVAYMFKSSWQYIEQLNAYKNGDFGIYMFDSAGGLEYETDAFGDKVQLIKIQSGSIHASEMPAVGDTAAKVKIEFTLDGAYKPEKVRYIANDDLGFNPFSNVDLPALVETMVNIISASTTALVIEVKSVFGLGVEGAVIGEWTLNNQTTDATVTIDTVTPDGTKPYRYTLAYSAGVTGADVLNPTLQKTGFYTYNSNKAIEPAV